VNQLPEYGPVKGDKAIKKESVHNAKHRSIGEKLKLQSTDSQVTQTAVSEQEPEHCLEKLCCLELQPVHLPM
jgi:hypothetical protein